jgi:signal transduction histidine kinase/CHASE3 domain sensor protein/ActR/RegA family two-component response regulator
LGTAERSAEHRFQTGFALAFGCVAIIGALSYWSLGRLTDNEAWVAHTDQVLGGLERLLSTETEGESAESGYVITGNEAYLASLERAAQAQRLAYEELRRLTADNDAQQRRLRALEPVLEAHWSDLRAIIDVRKTQSLEAAQRRIQDSLSAASHDAARSAIDEMKAAEGTLLEEREVRSRRSTRITQATVVGGSGLALILVALSMTAVRREFAGRRRAEAALRAANERLEDHVVERTAELSRSNDSLQTSERRFRAYVGATSDVVYRMSADWGEMYQLQGRDFIADTHDPSRTWLDKYIHPDDQARVRAAIGEAIRSKSTFQLEHRVLRPDGTLGWTFSRAIPLMDQDGRITEWFGAASDVTQRKDGEAKLQAQLARLSLLGEITRAIGERQDVQSIFQIVVRTLEGELRVDFCCMCLYDSAENALTVTSVGTLGAPVAARLAMRAGTEIEIDENGLSRCVRGQLVYEPDVRGVDFPFPQRLAAAGLCSVVAAPLIAESRVFGVLVTARNDPHGFSSGECEFLRQLSEHVGLASDQARLYQALQQAYDDLKQTQQAVMQQERLLALGKMASGIAHDINNAISPITLYVEFMLESEQGLSPAVRSNLEVIQSAIENVSRTVFRMREFYRAREPQQALLAVDLNRLVGQVLELTRARWGDMAQQRGVSINVRTELSPDVPAIAGIENELRDVLTNLVFNAIDAMPGGGELLLRTSVIGSQVQLEVADTGVGMDEETRRRCLEPFFTTKGERGTGLGLAMVYGAVQRHGADLDIQSAPGEGTTIRVGFPVPSATISVGRPLEAIRVAARLRILLVDDDPLILRSLRDTLQGDGHDVTATDGGQAGIDAFLSSDDAGRPYQVVITDLGMPKVDGRKVAAAVKSRRPDTLVLLLTGWGRRMVAEGDIPPNIDRVLGKPPKLRELREALVLRSSSQNPRA